MSANTKIFVLRSKELIYTTILIALAIISLIIIISLCGENKVTDSSEDSSSSQSTQNNLYTPGIYTTSFSLGNNDIQLQITVDSDHINDISLVNLSEAVTTMFPLIEPTLSDLSSKIIETQSIENITYPDETKYTSTILLNALETALQKAKK